MFFYLIMYAKHSKLFFLYGEREISLSPTLSMVAWQEYFFCRLLSYDTAKVYNYFE